MEQLICHLLGDYVLQTDWMARTKHSSLIAALVHALVYTLPFILLTRSAWALLVICSTHVIIDRYRLAGVVMSLKKWSWKKSHEAYATPPEVSAMLHIVIDNTLHLAINYLAIKYLG